MDGPALVFCSVILLNVLYQCTIHRNNNNNNLVELTGTQFLLSDHGMIIEDAYLREVVNEGFGDEAKAAIELMVDVSDQTLRRELHEYTLMFEDVFILVMFENLRARNSRSKCYLAKEIWDKARVDSAWWYYYVDMIAKASRSTFASMGFCFMIPRFGDRAIRSMVEEINDEFPISGAYDFAWEFDQFQSPGDLYSTVLIPMLEWEPIFDEAPIGYNEWRSVVDSRFPDLVDGARSSWEWGVEVNDWVRWTRTLSRPHLCWRAEQYRRAYPESNLMDWVWDDDEAVEESTTEEENGSEDFDGNDSDEEWREYLGVPDSDEEGGRDDSEDEDDFWDFLDARSAYEKGFMDRG